MVHVRQALLSDSPAIYEIEQLAHISPWSEGLINGSFSDRNHNYVAEANGVVVGYLFTSFIAGELTLENICVAKGSQGQGIGHKLMDCLLQLATDLNALDIWLEVRESNTSAIALYVKSGFSQQGVRKNYYSVPDSTAKENALLMKKAC